MKMNQSNQSNDLSYYRLSLLSFLQESHPEQVNNSDLIESRVELAGDIYSQAVKEGLSQQEAEELANLTLFRGLLFSKHDTLVNILWNEFSDIVPQSEAKDFAIHILPQCEEVFSGYPLSDEFMYSPGYEKLYTELTGFIDLWLEENEL